MKLSQNSFDEFEYYITPSDMIEFLYCRRFIYYMKCLSIPQFEENRFKVQKGREVHEKKESQNKQYLRKKLGVVDKQIDVDLKDIKSLRRILGSILRLWEGISLRALLLRLGVLIVVIKMCVLSSLWVQIYLKN